MTNFEKWKMEITVNDIENLIVLLNCARCPACGHVNSNETFFECRKCFERWANTDAEIGCPIKESCQYFSEAKCN